MSEYIITCCSTSDLSQEYFEKRNIGVTYFTFELGGTEYPDDMGKSVPPKELFRRMLEGEDTKTSQVTVGKYTEFFEPYLKDGKDVLHIAFSSGLSGSYNSARLAAEELSAKYPERKLYVVDSLAAST
ncbi:MAG: DegV family protein, partial [Lachnospiraceae bacterium]|nr:DegV family protein [Lachnospiraceae bacterium]